MSEPLGELEFYLKRAEATVKRNPERYGLVTMMVNNITKDVKYTIHGDAETLLSMTTCILAKVILKVWDDTSSDQERIELLASVTEGLTEAVTDAWKKAQESTEE